jgi:hypothetical protein
MIESVEYAVEIFREGWVQPEIDVPDESGFWATEILAAAWLETKFRAMRDQVLKTSGRLIDREDFLKNSKSVVAVGPEAELSIALHNLTHPERPVVLQPVQIHGAARPALPQNGKLHIAKR